MKHILFLLAAFLFVGIFLGCDTEKEPAKENKKPNILFIFAETFLDICKAPIPNYMQGKTIVPLLKGKTPKDWRENLYYHYYEEKIHGVARHEGVSDKRYKLIFFYKEQTPNGQGEWEFYDLEKDPSEMNNFYGSKEYAQKIDEMKEELKLLRLQYKVDETDVPKWHR